MDGAMKYDYKCIECEKIHEVEVQTSDIMDGVGRVNQKILSERINEQRFCACGGELRKVFSVVKDVLWFNEHTLKGKISQRYA